MFDTNIKDYFDPSKKIDLDSYLNEDKKIMLSFEELKEYAKNYEIVTSSLDLFDNDQTKFQIKNSKTKNIETNPFVIKNAFFANIWLASAGINYTNGESVPGFTSAFSNSSKELYEIICTIFNENIRDEGCIDTVGLFSKIDRYTDYENAKEVIVNLFKNEFANVLAPFIAALYLQMEGCRLEVNSRSSLLSKMHLTGALAFLAATAT